MSMYRTTFDKLEKNLNLSDLSWPLSIKQISIFEKNNPQFSFNVYELGSGSNRKSVVRGPLYYSRKKREHHVDLLLITSPAGQSHFCWIRNLSRLVRSQLTRKHASIQVCDRCLQTFTTVERLRAHEQDCSEIGPVRVVLPTVRNNILSFTSFEKKMTVPFVVYIDFEAVLLPVSTCQPSVSASYSTAYQLHKCFAVGLQIVCSYDETKSRYLSYTGTDCAEWLLDELAKLAHEYNALLATPVPLRMTEDEQTSFNTGSICQICEKRIDDDLQKMRPLSHELTLQKFCTL